MVIDEESEVPPVEELLKVSGKKLPAPVAQPKAEKKPKAAKPAAKKTKGKGKDGHEQIAMDFE